LNATIQKKQSYEILQKESERRAYQVFTYKEDQESDPKEKPKSIREASALPKKGGAEIIGTWEGMGRPSGRRQGSLHS